MKSDSWNILLFSSREDLDRIKLRKNRNVFEIAFNSSFSPYKPSPVLIISMPELVKLELDGRIQMEAGGFSSSEDLDVHMSEGVFLNLNGFEAGDAQFVMNGSGELHAFLSAETINLVCRGDSIVRIGGRVHNLNLKSDGASHIDGTMLLTDNVDLQLKGLSEIRITPDISMKILSRDEAVIYYSDRYMDGQPENEGNAILRKY